MKSLLHFVALVAICSPLLSHQESQAPSVAQKTENALRVQATIMKQKYCRADAEVFRIDLDIKLRFTNIRDQPVILSKRIENPTITRVAKSVDAAKHDNFAYDPNVDFFPTELASAPRFGETLDREHFVILNRGESYETTVSPYLFGTVKAKKHKGRGLLNKGIYVLQLGIDTWPYDWPFFARSNDVQQLSQQWSKYGHLVTQSIYSDFTPLTISQGSDSPPCEEIQKKQ